MAEHTPTPWRVEKDTGLIWGDCTMFDDGTPDRLGVPVTDGQLERPWAKGNGPTYDEMEANAAFIVKAVNEYADAEKALLELCSRHGYATGHGDTLADIIREIDGQIPGVCVGRAP